MGRIGFPAYELTNTGAELRRLTQRLAAIEQAKAAPDTEQQGEHARIEDSASDNRIRIFFPGKPDDTTRATLKRQGFRWTPSLGCWQAYRHNHTIRFAREIAGVAS